MKLSFFVLMSCMILMLTAVEALAQGDLSVGQFLALSIALFGVSVVAVFASGNVAGHLQRFTDKLPARKLRSIKINGARYLDRFHLFSIGSRFDLYLHHFVSGVGDECMHDHPFRAVCIMLAGSYTETRGLGPNRSRHLSAPAINILGAGTVHQITSVTAGTWTLCFVWRTDPHWHIIKRESGVYDLSRFSITKIQSDREWYKKK